MCGRYSILDDIDDLCQRFACLNPGIESWPRYNVAPSQTVPVVVEDGRMRQIRLMRWGMIPYWAKDAKIGNRLINARIETLAEKPAFRGSLRRFRCLVPADSYYEWHPEASGKKPYRVVALSREVFSFAGLWDRWVDPQGTTISSFTIVTTDPVPEIAWLHNRMPLALPRSMEEKWLLGPEEGEEADIPKFLLEFVPRHDLTCYRVSTLVNSPAHDVPEVLAEAKD